MATKREMFALIASALADNAEVVEFCNHEVELLDRKRGQATKPSKRQLENAEVKGRILEVLGESDAPMTCGALAEVLGITGQRCSALLTQLVKAEAVCKTYEKKVAYFGVA